MKKLLVILIALLVLCGCAEEEHNSKVSNGEEVFYKTSEGEEITKEEIYEYAKNFDIESTLTNTLILKLCAIKGIDTSDFASTAEEEIAAAYEQGYGDYITYYYGSEQNYIDNYVSYQAQNELIKSYVSDNFDAYLNDYNPYQASMVYFEDETIAKNVISTVNEETTFAYACTLYGYTNEVVEHVYTKADTEVPSQVTEFVNNATEPGLSDVITVENVTTDSEGNSTTTYKYYIVNLISKDVEEFKDDFISKVAEEEAIDTVVINLLKQYPMTIHDQDVYDVLSEKYEVLK